VTAGDRTMTRQATKCSRRRIGLDSNVFVGCHEDGMRNDGLSKLTITQDER